MSRRYLKLSMAEFRSGMVALVGKPNVGKSTLINALLGWKYSIVSPKPQTTRKCTRYVITRSLGGQIVFIDTPGLHKALHLLGKAMEKQLCEVMEKVDLVCYIVDARTRNLGSEDVVMIERMKKNSQAPVILVINKIDLVDNPSEAKERLISLYGQEINIKSAITLSALTAEGVDEFVGAVIKMLPEGDLLYPPEFVGDFTEKFVAEEIIREKILEETEQEVPHSVAVVIEEFKNPEEYPERNTLFIRADIYVERQGQKGILIGKGGRMLKKIGKKAREEIEKQFGYPTYLDLWVKVRPGWRNSERELRRMGYL